MTDINGNTTGALSNVATNPLDKDLNISDYNIVGLPFGSSLRTIQSTQILQTSIINDSANKLLNVGDVVLGTTEMTGMLKVPNLQTNVISDTASQESNINIFNGEIQIQSPSLSYNNNPIVTSPYNDQIIATSFKVNGGTSDTYLMSDGSLLKYSANSGNSNYYLYKSSTTQDVTPPIGDITYNNAVQANATMIYISHRTRDTIDIEIFFKQLSTLIEVYIQDQDTSLNYIQYNITGTPTITAEAQVAIPVIMRVGAGTGLTNFPNGHNVLLSFFTNSIETDLRISTLENKTINQTAINGVSTQFNGTNGVISTKFMKPSGGNPLHFWMTDGSTNSNTYALDSDLINTNSNITTLQTKTQNLSSNTTTSTFTGTGGIISDKFVTNTGTSLMFVKGDGSLDSTGYATLSLVNDVVNLINPVITKTQYQSIVGTNTSFTSGLLFNCPITLTNASLIDIASNDRPYIGLQYQHNSSGVPTVQSNSLITPFGSTALNATPWVNTNNFTRQYACGLWTTVALADGAPCGYGGTAGTGAYVTTNGSFGLTYILGIADTAYNANNCQNFFGLWWLQTVIPLTQAIQLNVQRRMICFGSSTTDANICIYTAGLLTTVKQVDLGSSFPANRPSGTVSTDWYKLTMYWDGVANMYYKAVNTTLNVTVSGMFTPNIDDMPAGTSCTHQCVRIMGSPQSNGQAKLKVQRFGIF